MIPKKLQKTVGVGMVKIWSFLMKMMKLREWQWVPTRGRHSLSRLKLFSLEFTGEQALSFVVVGGPCSGSIETDRGVNSVCN